LVIHIARLYMQVSIAVGLAQFSNAPPTDPFVFAHCYAAHCCRCRCCHPPGWGNYKSDGSAEGKALFFIVAALVVRGEFTPASVRNTYLCPSGFNKEKELASLIAMEPQYKCKDFAGLVSDYFTAPVVLPGDPEFDAE
jgi:hypothetical protein